MKTWVLLSDLQIPWQDKKAVELALTFAEEIQPHGVVLNGDIVDCYDLSDFDKNPKRDFSQEGEIRESGELMERLAKVTKERWYIQGNHEDRLRRTLWRNPKLAHIPHLQFENLLPTRGVRVPTQLYGGVLKLGRLLVTHGSSVSKHSGWSARAHFEKYGQSVLIGHTHRQGMYVKTNARGTHYSYEGGCLCRLDPEYITHPDWQHGFSVVRVEDNGQFSVQLIPILNRTLYYGGDRFTLPMERK